MEVQFLSGLPKERISMEVPKEIHLEYFNNFKERAELVAESSAINDRLDTIGKRLRELDKMLLPLQTKISELLRITEPK